MKIYPLINFVIFFLCGIILEYQIQIPTLLIFIIFTTLLLILLILFVLNRKIQSTVFASLLFLVIGFSYSSINKNNTTPYPFEKEKIRNVEVSGIVKDLSLLRNGKIEFVLLTKSIFIDSLKFDKEIELKTNIYDTTNSINHLYENIKIGDSIFVKGTILKGRGIRNPGEFDYNKYLNDNGITAILNIYKINEVKVINNSNNFVSNNIFDLRKSIDNQLRKISSKETYALLRGLILADRSQINYLTRESFVKSGVIHVLAVSGLHVGFIALIFIFLFGRFNPVAKYLLTILGLLLFLVITGSPTSVTRAVIMAIFLIVGFLSTRNYNSINSLCLAALTILLINPSQLFSPGFQLSFSAVMSILLIYPILKNLVPNKWNNAFTNLLLISLAAQIGTLPFTIYYFHKISIIGILANLFVIPLISIILGTGIITLVISYISLWFASIFSYANKLFVYLLNESVNILSNFSFSYLEIHNYSLYDSIIYLTLIIGIITIIKFSNNNRFVISSVILLIINSVLYSSFDNKSFLKENLLNIYFIDVGQGDAFIIKFPNSKIALIDTGNKTKYFDNGERIIDPILKRFNIDKIDYAFLSHIDSDHYGGFKYLVKNYKINKFYKPPLIEESVKDSLFELSLMKNNINKIYFKESSLVIGNCKIYVLQDDEKLLNSNLNVNDKSGILKLVYGNTSFLFTGDAGVSREYMLKNRYDKFLESDLLKLGHHGSKTSTSTKFLNLVNPKYAVAQAGIENKFNHPSKEIVNRIKSKRIPLYRTDELGGLLIQSNGENIKFVNWRNSN